MTQATMMNERGVRIIDNIGAIIESKVDKGISVVYKENTKGKNINNLIITEPKSLYQTELIELELEDKNPTELASIFVNENLKNNPLDESTVLSDPKIY